MRRLPTEVDVLHWRRRALLPGVKVTIQVSANGALRGVVPTFRTVYTIWDNQSGGAIRNDIASVR
jgi:hypothetical protein